MISRRKFLARAACASIAPALPAILSTPEYATGGVVSTLRFEGLAYPPFNIGDIIAFRYDNGKMDRVIVTASKRIYNSVYELTLKREAIDV